MIFNGFSHSRIYFQKLGTVKLWRFFFLKNDSWLIRIASFCKILYEAIRKKVQQKYKFVKYFIFRHFKFFSLKIIFSLSNELFNNNIAILESEIIYFYPRSNFRWWTTLKKCCFWIKLKKNSKRKLSSIFFIRWNLITRNGQTYQDNYSMKD